MQVIDTHDKMNIFSILVLLLFFAVSACKSGDNIDNQANSFAAFVAQFPKLKLPYSYTGDSLLAKAPDSLRIKNAVRNKFLPDSVFFPKEDTTALVYAIGRGKSDEDQKRWLFLKMVNSEAKRVYVMIFDQNDSLLVVKKVAASEKKTPNKTLTFKWTRKHLLNVYEKTGLGNGYVSYKREVFSLLGGDHLQMILTNNSGHQDSL